MNIELASRIDTDYCEELRLNGGMSAERREFYYTRLMQALIAREVEAELLRQEYRLREEAETALRRL